MVAIPTIIELGNGELNGGLPTVPTTLLDVLGGTHWNLRKNKPRLNWPVPADGATGALASPVTFLPWFDTTLDAGVGNFTAYHQVAGILSAPYNVNKGDCTTAGGVGVGASAWWMQKFADLFSISPYFKAIKLAYPGALYNNWKVGGAAYALSTPFFTRAASVTSPDTLDVKLIILNFGGGTDGDIATVGTWYTVHDYKALMTALIADLRSILNSPNAKVIIISNAESYLLTTGTSFGALLLKQMNHELTQELTGVHTVEMKDEDLGTSTGAYGDVALGANRRSYQQDAYYDQGQRIYDTYVRATTSAVPITNSAEHPVILSIGDSQSVGSIVGAVQAALYSTGISGTQDNRYTFNVAANALQKITAGVSGNLNTVGTVTTTCGMELTLSDSFAGRYPDGFTLLHHAKGGTSITAVNGNDRWKKGLNEMYEDFQQHVADAKSAIMNQTGAVQVLKTPVVVAIFIQLGDNDTNSLATATAFKSELRILINNLRADFCGEHYGIKVPVILGLPHIRNVTHGSPAIRALIRNGIMELAEEMDQVGYLNIDHKDLNVDGVHYPVEVCLSNGTDFYNKFVEVLEAAIPVI